MSNKIICPICFSKSFSLYEKDKDGYQKYICKTPTCKRQFTVDKYFKPRTNYPKCPVCNFPTYLHHDYEFSSRFTCNSKKCNHHFSVIKSSLFFKEDLKLPNAINIKRLRTYIDSIIEALFYILVALVLLDLFLNIFLILNPLKFHMCPFTNGLKDLEQFLKSLQKKIFLKI